MKSDGIKKALECCPTRNIAERCKGCAYGKAENCDGFTNISNRVLEDALKLITEQEQEIKRLKNKYFELKTDLFNHIINADI